MMISIITREDQLYRVVKIKNFFFFKNSIIF